ncbi:MAG: hypothetical protein EAZ67_14260, partial [Cytophagales bacterium]
MKNILFPEDVERLIERNTFTYKNVDIVNTGATYPNAYTAKLGHGRINAGATMKYVQNKTVKHFISPANVNYEWEVVPRNASGIPNLPNPYPFDLTEEYRSMNVIRPHK